MLRLQVAAGAAAYAGSAARHAREYEYAAAQQEGGGGGAADASGGGGDDQPSELPRQSRALTCMRLSLLVAAPMQSTRGRRSSAGRGSSGALLAGGGGGGDVMAVSSAQRRQSALALEELILSDVPTAADGGSLTSRPLTTARRGSGTGLLSAQGVGSHGGGGSLAPSRRPSTDGGDGDPGGGGVPGEYALDGGAFGLHTETVRP